MAQTVGGRILAIDVARTVAILMMVTFHFTYDLEMFGFIPGGTTTHGFWALFARATAGSFLFLVGFSLYLSHGQGIRWPSFWKRFAKVAGAAALVSAGTFLVMPNTFVYFGILHSISVASLLGLAFLRLPAVVTLVLGAVVIALPNYVSLPALNSPFFYWTGLSTWWPPSIDYEPVFPWFGPALFGIGAAKALTALLPNALMQSAAAGQGSLQWLASFPGRHSLVIYLAHQPVLISVIWIYLMLS
jgi:uncharacterized membrane protein